ncbi:guanyl-specific ribonuclease F1 [Hyaloscypha variabilis]|uniref:ribonuclease T1 n=1 Tax=Hyaloscypha variabilis (strain UAMH 11265 / GT02V1 / F) TaxID=1149755 RepID=A0A2J6SDJ9_HYAVF|nr:guanyl-specific ribonuclease F1 [Hyaloscypha variabilis F]
MKLSAIVVLFAVSAVAQSISDEPTSSDCDGTIYSQQNIDDAATAALSYYASGETVGRDSYPHQYKDYEGFSFTCSAPYLEFPIETSGVYSGGSPGADRVVIGSISSDESTAEYCAVITHDGQSGNDFGECTDS